MASADGAAAVTDETKAAPPDVEPVPFRITADEAGRAGDSRVTFIVPAAQRGLVEVVAQRPIAVNGALFELKVDRVALAAGNESDEGALYTVFYSPKPEKTATAIAKRLALRLQDPEGALSAEEQCVIC
eukprot:TRINITY_DN17818_c0_g1_i4.p2 TRINITY_DN17818_c0_g1~~TRINITY_DN17818_c0_g1_i4.p2  ORF type:complete len:129 (-),score=32.12 TRINITY_DN17818_c0_g1_i4:645-1031(-)